MASIRCRKAAADGPGKRGSGLRRDQGSDTSSRLWRRLRTVNQRHGFSLLGDKKKKHKDLIFTSCHRMILSIPLGHTCRHHPKFQLSCCFVKIFFLQKNNMYRIFPYTWKKDANFSHDSQIGNRDPTHQDPHQSTGDVLSQDSLKTSLHKFRSWVETHLLGSVSGKIL